MIARHRNWTSGTMAEMSRRERREHQRQLERLRREQQRIVAATPRPRLWRRIFSGTNVVVGTFVTFLAFLGGWFLFHPHVSLHPDQRLNPNDPFSTEFTITNEGNFDIQNLTSTCIFGNVETTHNVGMYGLARPSLQTIPQIEPRVSSTVECLSFIGGIGAGAGNVRTADIALRLEYRQKWWPARMTEIYRFQSKLGTDGIVHWIPRTLSE